MSLPYVECPFHILGINYLTSSKHDVQEAWLSKITKHQLGRNAAPARVEPVRRIHRAKDMALSTFEGFEKKEGPLPEFYPHISYLVQLHQDEKARKEAAEARTIRLRDHLERSLATFFEAEQSLIWKNDMQQFVFIGQAENLDAKAFREHIARLNVLYARHHAGKFAEESIRAVDKVLECKLKDVAWEISDQERRMRKLYSKCGWHAAEAAHREDVVRDQHSTELDNVRQELRDRDRMEI